VKDNLIFRFPNNSRKRDPSPLCDVYEFIPSRKLLKGGELQHLVTSSFLPFNYPFNIDIFHFGNGKNYMGFD
jgi:hypothetical protein